MECRKLDDCTKGQGLLEIDRDVLSEKGSGHLKGLVLWRSWGRAFQTKGAAGMNIHVGLSIATVHNI